MILGRKGFTVKHTLFASYIAYVVQAIVINFVPLLFVTFQKDYGLTLEMLTLIVTINFIMQLTYPELSERKRICWLLNRIFPEIL